MTSSSVEAHAQAQAVTDAYFTLQRVRNTKNAALELLRAHAPPPPRSSSQSSASHNAGSSSRTSDYASSPASAAETLSHPAHAYLQHLRSLRWSELAEASLSHTFLAYHAAAVLTLVSSTALLASASSLSSPSSCTRLLSRLHALHGEWETIEQRRAGLLQHHAYGSALQLSIIPPSPFPSATLVERVTACLLSSLSKATISSGDALSSLIEQCVPALQSLSGLQDAHEAHVQRLFSTSLPHAESRTALPTLSARASPLPLPTLHALLVAISDAVRVSLLSRSSPTTTITEIASADQSHQQQLISVIRSTWESLTLRLLTPSLPPAQYLADVAAAGPAPLAAGEPILPPSFSPYRSDADTTSHHREVALCCTRPSLSADTLFLLRLQPSLFSDLSALHHALTTADHRPARSFDIPAPPSLSAYVPLFRRLLLTLLAQPSDNDLVRRMKASRWMRHFHSSAERRLTQHVQHSVARYSDLHADKLEQPLHLHSDLSHLSDALTAAEPDPRTAQAAAPTFPTDRLLAVIRGGTDSLASACVEHCRRWLTEQQRLMFGEELSNRPLVVATYPRPLPRTEDFDRLLAEPDSATATPYLLLYVQWFAPLRLRVRRYHPATQAVMAGLLSALHASLLDHLRSLLHGRARINANGAALLRREVDFIAWHSSLPSVTSSPAPEVPWSTASAPLHLLSAALHVLTHPSQYRAVLPYARRASSATVAPLPAPGEGDTGVKLPGHALADWKDWLALSSAKYRREWQAGWEEAQRNVDAAPVQDDDAGQLGCGWWRRAHSATVAPMPLQ